MLQAILNTKVYMGGAPFDTEGDDTYQLPGWSENGKLKSINFYVDEGDAKQVLMELLDQDAESITARLLYKETLSPRTMKVYDPPIELIGAKKPRIYMRLTALDGTEQNHCKVVLNGTPVS